MSSKPFRALRHRNFRLFFSGQLISLIGTWMQTVAQSWLIFRLTNSSFLLGVVGFASQIPVFLVSPIGGHLADRIDRRRIMIATQTASMVLAFALAALTLSGRVHEWHVIVLAVVLGLVNAFDLPARQAALVQMVEREDLMNAIALNSSMFNGARVVGPAVAGLLVAAIGEGWCFFANGASYIAVIIGLMMMRISGTREGHAVSGTAIANIIEGFRYAARTAPIRALLILLGVISFCGMPYAVLMPVFAESIFHSGARGLGILMGASGAGALIGSMVLTFRSDVKGLGRWVAVTAGLFGATSMLFALSHSFWLAAFWLIPVGATVMVQMAASNTLIQAMVPDELRGRIMAVYSMMFMGMGPLGSLLAGGVANRAGAPVAVAAGGAISVVAAIVFGMRLPNLRGPARELILAQQYAGGDPVQEQTATGTEA